MMAQNLTSKQRQAIAALLSSRNVQEAALLAHVSQRTLWRWLSDTFFRNALLKAEGNAIDSATRRLIGLKDASIDTLVNVLQDKKTTASVRLRAAQAVLDYLLKFRELQNIEERISQLEATVNDKYK